MTHFSATVLQGEQFFSICFPVTISVWGQDLCVPLSVSPGNNILKHENKQKRSVKKGMEEQKEHQQPCLWCTNLFTMMSIEFYTNYLSIHSSISNMVVYRIKIIFLLKKSNTPIVHDQPRLSLHINQVTPRLQFNKCNMKTVHFGLKQSGIWFVSFKPKTPAKDLKDHALQWISFGFHKDV